MQKTVKWKGDIMKKIGMLIAIDTELMEYFKSLSSVERLTGLAYDVWTTTVYGKQLFIIKSGAGEISASGATQFLISAFGVEVIINFGICGKLSPSLKILDTVVVNAVVHYQYDTSAIDNVEPGRYLQFDSVYIKPDSSLIQRLQEIDGEIKPAICASADLFVAKEEDKKFLRETYNADVCEMEAAGILITCKKNNIPCLMVKSVSDDCDDMDFKTYCSLAAAKHVQLINEFVKNY